MFATGPTRSPDASLVELVDACGGYGRRRALDRVTFTAEAGEMVFVTGRSGAGKTSLLRLINGELRVWMGTAWVAGFPLHRGTRRARRVRRHIGVVFQDYALVASMTALENVEFAYRVAHLWETGRQARQRAHDAIVRVGLESRSRAFPGELSGGEQQRIAIARALVSDPDIVLADEPTGNLDRENSLEVLSLLERAADRGALVVVATHDTSLILPGCRRLHMDGGRLVSGLAHARAS